MLSMLLFKAKLIMPVNLLKVKLILLLQLPVSACVYLYFSTACAVGTYGFECSETCGNCRDANQCLNTNGTCLGGCKDGFQGFSCKSRE